MKARNGRPVQIDQSISYGRRTIEFKLRYSYRKRLAISVHPDQRVTVDAPIDQREDVVLARVRQRASWIVKQIERFETFHPFPGPKRYISGETIRYLGRQYRLKVVKDEKEEAKLVGAFLWVHTRWLDSREAKSHLVDQWYRKSARVVFSKRMIELAERLGLPGQQTQRWRLQAMKSKWGSCSQRGTITLNPELVKAPLSCIEYVIAHELCHLKELNHTKEFFKHLSHLLPDWRERKAKLDQVVLA